MGKAALTRMTPLRADYCFAEKFPLQQIKLLAIPKWLVACLEQPIHAYHTYLPAIIIQ